MPKVITRMTLLIECLGDPLGPVNYGAAYVVQEGGREYHRLLELENFDGFQSQGEAVDAAVDAVESIEGVEVSLGDILKKVYLVAAYNKDGTIKSESWYDTDNGDGTYVGIVEQTTYAYDKNKLISKTLQRYWADGSPNGDPITWTYYYNELLGQVIEKLEL